MTSACCKTLTFFLLFCWIGIPQGLADIAQVSLSQQVSISGFVTACDPGCQMLYGISSPGQSFSVTNVITPNISDRADDSIPLDPSNPFSGREASVDASANQFYSLTPTNLNVGLSVSADFSGNSDLMFGSADATSQYSLVFDLTNPYVVHITGGMSGGTSPFGPLEGGLGIDVSFDGEIHMSGPGLHFDRVFTSSSGDQLFDQFLTLGPGQYTLNVVAGLDSAQSDILDTIAFQSSDLSADFTPAIPEPAQVSTFLGLLMVVGLFFYHGHAAGFKA